MSEATFIVRPLERSDREWVAHFLDEHWGSTQIVSQGRTLYGHLLPGFVAEQPTPLPEDNPDDADLDDDETAENPVVEMQKLGLLTYNVEDKVCEIATLNSTHEGIGVGSGLLDALVRAGKDAALERIWLTITNDNLPAMRFLQKRGFRLVKIHRSSVHEARRLKPQIPLTGTYDIPIHDEIELEYVY